MPIIKPLSEHLINQIAAGEVVERPASVVKELVENALDAGATQITIEIKNGGDEGITITDNGLGMDRQDATMAFERHATSKISQTEDLFNLHTLGFRGEAIASIASVAKVRLTTKKRGDLEGTFVEYAGGKMNHIKPIGAPEGTSFEMLDLFYNTPARKKYLKTSTTEYQHIANTVIGIALACPETAFRLIHNQRIVFDVPVQKDLLSRIRTLMGKAIASELIPVFCGHVDLRIEGFIGKPLIARSNRNSQYLFVNRRKVNSTSLSYAAKESYHSLLPKEKYPVFFLYLTINPELIDVNVHPRKLEIKFREEKNVFQQVSAACKKALTSNILAPNIRSGDNQNYYAEPKPEPLNLHEQSPQSAWDTLKEKVDNSSNPNTNSNFNTNFGQKPRIGSTNLNQKPRTESANLNTIQEALQFTEQFGQTLQQDHISSHQVQFSSEAQHHNQLASEASETEHPGKTFANPLSDRQQLQYLIPLAQLANAYILCQQGKNLVILDQHAAHERIRYTEILKEFEAKKPAIQPLLTPLQLELSAKEQALLSAHRELFQNLGFDIEAFGGNTFIVNTVPQSLVRENVEQTLFGLFDDVETNAQKGDFQKRQERALTYMACRSAVKFGDPLSAEEQKALVRQLITLDLPFTCPHGRPTMVIMSWEELKRRFGREY